ncbi:MAG: ATP phosphoribosyltransferase regulatory subunit, partial [Lachnospiraceae bacterium]|nr:ATP phosphoribosyltransferase regulatory subunit [Lachnospiraceae bacterium]
ENLNLLFKILKRGEKLQEAIASGNPKELSDMGLRYDLTLPLSRYYACNRNSLSTPFKVIQIDRVFRAERPQKGRLREFVQCDIDILGSSSTNCEVELIDTTAKALLNIGIENFKIRINDRRILKNLIAATGFEAADADSVCITFDKLDKIGAEGVRKELLDKGFADATVEKFVSMMSITPFTLEEARKYCTDTEAIDSVASIIDTVKQLSGDRYQIEYDRSLVRGQGYYTGTIFEVESLDFGSSIAGGGRYDNMIGKFIGESVPAVGFSIGFERIASILMDKQAKLSGARPKLAVIYPENDVVAAIKKADEYRAEYDVTLFEKPKKIGKLFGKLEDAGFYGCLILDESSDIKILQK